MDPMERRTPVDRMPDLVAEGRLSRRRLLGRAAVFGLSVPALGALLAACGGDDEDEPATTTGTGAGSTATSGTGAGGSGAATATRPAGSPAASPSGGSSGGATAKPGGSLKFGITVDALTFDPHNYQATTDLAINNLIYDTLIGADSVSLELIPRLVTKWEVQSDNITWRMELRENVKFQDGEPFNAEAVKFNIERMLNAARAKSYAAPIKSVNVVDASTVAIITNGPSATLLRNLTVCILSIVSPKAAQSGENALVSQPVGTGAFKLREWVPKERIVIERNPDYWGEKAYLDEITFFPVPDDASRLSAYQAGDFDAMLNPPLETVKQLRSDNNNQVILSPATRTVWLGFNLGDETLKNEKLRQAIGYAVNEDLLVTAVAEELVRMGVGLVPPEILEPNFELPFKFDQNRAKQLLQEAGVGGGLTLQFWTPQGRYPKDRQIAEAIQQMLNEIGITAELSVVEWGPYLESLARHEQQLYLIGWGFSSGDPDGGLRQIAWSQSAFNYTNLQDQQVDAALDAAAQELDEQKRADMYNTLQKGLIDKAQYLPIYHNVTISVAKKNVKNFVLTPFETFDFKGTYIG